MTQTHHFTKGSGTPDPFEGRFLAQRILRVRWALPADLWGPSAGTYLRATLKSAPEAVAVSAVLDAYKS